MIVIIDYGMGNIASIQNMYKYLGIDDVILSKDPNEIKKADKLILPGVGAFDNGMHNLKKSDLIALLNQKVLEEKTPVLGICLGMQLLTKGSEEGVEPGLGWIDGKTIKFQSIKDLRIPHMGWNYARVQKKNPLIKEGKHHRFYFVHSYYVHCNDPEQSILQAKYGKYFTCGVLKDNVIGVQFHPEKSHKFGMSLLKNFAQYQYNGS